MSYEYIKRTYTFQPQVGKRVRHTETGKIGTIAREKRSAGHHVQVQFDGQSFALPCHPMALEYLAWKCRCGWQGATPDETIQRTHESGFIYRCPNCPKCGQYFSADEIEAATGQQRESA